MAPAAYLTSPSGYPLDTRNSECPKSTPVPSLTPTFPITGKDLLLLHFSYLS